MIIGIDLDNTLICYDQVFALAAKDRGWVSEEVSDDKLSVRENVKSRLGNEVWTELQGLVYGRFIHQAILFPNAKEVLGDWRAQGHVLHVISHKTQYPAVGEKVDLRDSAQAWLSKCGLLAYLDGVTYCDTREHKVATINSKGCEVFVDDLPEVLLHRDLNRGLDWVLFDPRRQHSSVLGVRLMHHWQEAFGLIH